MPRTRNPNQGWHNRRQTVGVHLTSADYERLSGLADRLGVSRAKFCTDAVVAALARQGAEDEGDKHE